MKKILITGFSGFVSQHFIQYLETLNLNFDILGIDINEPDFIIKDTEYIKIVFKKIDLLNTKELENCIYYFQPEYLLHLASYSSVGFSWKNPLLSFRNNMDIFLNLLEIIKKVIPSCRILSVGSSEEYGNVISEMIPLKEEYRLSPLSPYAVARVAQENMSKVYCDGYGLNIVMTRSFNHIGPGQKEIFVISSFAKQLVEIKKGIRKETKLITGDTSIIRDFLDVRDVVVAYYKLLLAGKNGEVYNVCSEQGVSLKDVIYIMCKILDLNVELEINPELIRPDDNKIIVGSNAKLRNATTWRQKYSLYDSLKNIIEYWKSKK